MEGKVCEIQKLKSGEFVYEGVLYDSIDDLLSDLKEDLSGAEEPGEDSGDAEMMDKKKKVKEMMSDEDEDY